MKNVISLFFITMMLMVSVSCSGGGGATGSDNGDEETELNPGDVVITITGAINDTREGMAYFNSLSGAGRHTWFFGFLDGIFDQTFLIYLEISYPDPVERPAPGVYTIRDYGSAPNVFLGTYSEIGEGIVTYSTREGEGGGTITIEESSEDRVKGKFEFTAVYDTERNSGPGSGTIRVEGRFYALSWSQYHSDKRGFNRSELYTLQEAQRSSTQQTNPPVADRYS